MIVGHGDDDGIICLCKHPDSRDQSNWNNEKETGIGTSKFEENCLSKGGSIHYRNTHVDNDKTANTMCYNK
jgi:hypothetical protein